MKGKMGASADAGSGEKMVGENLCPIVPEQSQPEADDRAHGPVDMRQALTDRLQGCVAAACPADVPTHTLGILALDREEDSAILGGREDARAVGARHHPWRVGADRAAMVEAGVRAQPPRRELRLPQDRQIAARTRANAVQDLQVRSDLAMALALKPRDCHVGAAGHPPPAPAASDRNSGRLHTPHERRPPYGRFVAVETVALRHRRDLLEAEGNLVLHPSRRISFSTRHSSIRFIAWSNSICMVYLVRSRRGAPMPVSARSRRASNWYISAPNSRDRAPSPPPRPGSPLPAPSADASSGRTCCLVVVFWNLNLSSTRGSARRGPPQLVVHE
jgi:hypothetical protein